MSIFAKSILSGSTDGKGIKVVQTATAGTLLHTGPTNTAHLHEVWIWAENNHTADVVLTIEWGDATTPDGNIIKTIPTKAGLYLMIPGLILKGNASPLTVKAFAATGNVIAITGYVNTIT